MNKKGIKKSTFITYLLILFILICGIFRYKNIFIEPNNVLEVSISNIIYPFTFLFIILIYNIIGFKETHKTIIKTTILFILFILCISVLNSVPGNYSTREVDMALKTVFTPNHFMVGTNTFYYPNILNVISFTLLFYFSHTLILILYEAMEPYTKKFIAFCLAMFIPFALDTLCYVSINDVFNEIKFETIITHLTSNFIIVIIGTLLMTIIYSLKKVSSKS